MFKFHLPSVSQEAHLLLTCVFCHLNIFISVQSASLRLAEYICKTRRSYPSRRSWQFHDSVGDPDILLKGLPWTRQGAEPLDPRKKGGGTHHFSQPPVRWPREPPLEGLQQGKAWLHSQDITAEPGTLRKRWINQRRGSQHRRECEHFSLWSCPPHPLQSAD